jgi:hypothetical protein
MATDKKKYRQFYLSVPKKYDLVIKMECRRIGMPMSKFFVSLFLQHFIKKYGIDLTIAHAEVHRDIMHLRANTYGAEYETIKPNESIDNLKPHTHNLKEQENEQQPKPQYKPLAESQYAKRIHEPLEQFDEGLADGEQ